MMLPKSCFFWGRDVFPLSGWFDVESACTESLEDAGWSEILLLCTFCTWRPPMQFSILSFIYNPEMFRAYLLKYIYMDKKRNVPEQFINMNETWR